MKQLEDVEAKHWCEERGLRVDGPVACTQVTMGLDEMQQFRVQVTTVLADQVVNLAYCLLMGAATGETPDSFSGGLVWLQRWEVGSEDIDRVGYALLGGLTAQPEAPFGGDICPAYVLDGSEFLMANALMSLPLIFGWDAHFIPNSGQFIICVSHDGFFDVFTRDQTEHERLCSLFHDAGWRTTCA